MSHDLKFAVHYHPRKASDSGPNCVLHALPGNLTAWGSDEDEAWGKLEATVAALVGRLGVEGAQAWFHRAVDAMSDEATALWEWVAKPSPRSYERSSEHATFTARRSEKGGCAVA